MNERDGIKKENRNMDRICVGQWTKEYEPNPFGPRLLYCDPNVQCMNIFIISITSVNQTDRDNPLHSIFLVPLCPFYHIHFNKPLYRKDLGLLFGDVGSEYKG
jgi:hypothetical protein